MINNKKNVEKQKLRKIYWNIVSLIIFIIISYCLIDPRLINKNNETIILIGIIYLPISFFILMIWVWYISELIHDYLINIKDKI